jgi:hypothetical protein
MVAIGFARMSTAPPLPAKAELDAEALLSVF